MEASSRHCNRPSDENRMSTLPPGLTSEEVADRAARGLTNRVKRSDAAEYIDIVQRNVVTLFNALVLPPAVVMLVQGDYRAGFAVCGGRPLGGRRSVDGLRGGRHVGPFG